MQHAVLVMKQLVLLHGVPSDVKVSSVFNEDSDREPLNHEGITARRSFWKSKPDSPTFPVTPGTPHVSSGAQAIQVRRMALTTLVQLDIWHSVALFFQFHVSVFRTLLT